MNSSKHNDLNKVYQSLNQCSLAYFIEAWQSTSDLDERDFLYTLLDFELKKRQSKVIQKRSDLIDE